MNAIPITCPRCDKSFSADLPVSEIINSERYSVVIANHPDPVICPDCNQKFTLAISEVRTGWVPIPDTNEGNYILDSPDAPDQNEGDRPDDSDLELDNLVRKIFDIIPSYYHEGEAAKIKRLITDYMRRRTVSRGVA